VCPLDANWKSRAYVRGESVCGLALEAVKPNGAETVRHLLADDAMSAKILTAAPEIAGRWSFIARRLARSASQGSRIRSAQAARMGSQRPAPNVA
jgi:hypothetical protein